MDPLFAIALVVLSFGAGVFLPSKSKYTDKDLQDMANASMSMGLQLGSQRTADVITQRCREEGVNLEDILGSDPIDIMADDGQPKPNLH